MGLARGSNTEGLSYLSLILDRWFRLLAGNLSSNVPGPLHVNFMPTWIPPMNFLRESQVELDRLI